MILRDKNMRKMAILLIVLIVVSVGFLSGCNENSINSEEKRFVGNWRLENSNTTYTFFSNGTCSISGVGGTYEIKDGKLVLDLGEGLSMTCDYSFTNNDNTLTIAQVGTPLSGVLTKQ